MCLAEKFWGRVRGVIVFDDRDIVVVRDMVKHFINVSKTEHIAIHENG